MLCPICKTVLSDEDQTFGCPMCGKLVEANAKVCPGCGAEFQEDGEQAEAIERAEPRATPPEEGADETDHEEAAMQKIDELVAEEIKELVKLPGVGNLKAKALYEAGFTDLGKLKAASVKQLMNVPGIGKRSAASIKRALQISDIDGLRKTRLSADDIEAEQACPICGTILSIFETSCFECGKEFQNAKVEGSEEKALAHYERMIELDTKNTDLWYARGSMLAKMGRNDEAIKSYEMATEIDPKYDAAWIAMAGLFTRMGDSKSAGECYKHVISAAGVTDLLPKTGTGEAPDIVPSASAEEVKAFERELLGEERACTVCNGPLTADGKSCTVCGKDFTIPAEGAPAETAQPGIAPAQPEEAPAQTAISEEVSQPTPERAQPAEAAPEPAETPAQGEPQEEAASGAVRIEDLDNISEKELYRILSSVASELKPMLGLAKELELDVTEGKRLISEAVAHGTRKEVKKAVTYILQGQKALTDALKVRLLKELSALENTAEELRLSGANVARASKLLKEAKGDLRKGAFSEVVPKLKDAKADIETFKSAMGGGAQA